MRTTFAAWPSGRRAKLPVFSLFKAAFSKIKSDCFAQTQTLAFGSLVFEPLKLSILLLLLLNPWKMFAPKWDQEDVMIHRAACDTRNQVHFKSRLLFWRILQKLKKFQFECFLLSKMKQKNMASFNWISSKRRIEKWSLMSRFVGQSVSQSKDILEVTWSLTSKLMCLWRGHKSRSWPISFWTIFLWPEQVKCIRKVPIELCVLARMGNCPNRCS